ncbi:MAG: hypothetical protein WDN27_03255 [Candidatus Saccharibacteria bacterium]
MSLVSRATQLRLRRAFRRRQKQVEAVAETAEKQFDTNLVGRFDRLLRVKRFAAGWLVLVLLVTLCTIVQTLGLSAYYQKQQPCPVAFITKVSWAPIAMPTPFTPPVRSTQPFHD